MSNKLTMHFSSAWVENQWKKNVALTIEDGLITSIEPNAVPDGQADSGVALPGIVNLHSHAFQRGFAGLSEYRTASRDSFWTWRELMYRFVQKLAPEDVFVIARQLYLEMMSAGYTWVGEFHYLHNQPDGTPFAHLSEMGDAVRRAAQEAGIGICQLPVLYQRGGFGNEALKGGQLRFGLSADQFIELYQSLSSHNSATDNCHSGIALHSLRAVDSKVGNQVVDHLVKSNPDLPIHIHVAEQVKEVSDCQAAHSMRSVEYLFDQYEVDRKWCLIHATHLNEREVEMIARSQAVVGLCPTTEANLGDGLFPAPSFLEQGGRIGVGSDSHCSVDFREELRLLEYGQRLHSRSRAVLGTVEQSVGRHLYRQCALGGGQAIGVATGEIAVGNRADLTLVDPDHPAISLAEGDRLIDRVVFANAGNPVTGVVVGGTVHRTDTGTFRERLAESARDFNRLCQRLMA